MQMGQPGGNGDCRFDSECIDDYLKLYWLLKSLAAVVHKLKAFLCPKSIGYADLRVGYSGLGSAELF